MDSAIGLIVAAHGKFAESLVETAEMILGGQTHLTPFVFAEGEEPRVSSQKLQSLIRKCDNGKGVIILVDLFGGTPGSLALSMLEEQLVEVVTGVNLPMAITAATLDPALGLEESTQALVQAGKNAIKGAGLILKT